MDEKRPITAKALLVGERIDLRALGSTQRLAGGPLAVPIRGDGLAVLFRFGAIVLFDVKPLEEDEFLRQLQPRISQPSTEHEVEVIKLRVDSEAKEVFEGTCVLVKDFSEERLEIVADVLAKSVVLSKYETAVSQQFDRIEPLAANLENQGNWRQEARELLRHLGSTLLIEQQMVGRVEVNDTPELLWDRPDLERLFARLRDEFEITERFTALNRKLELISRTVETVLDLLQSRRSLRVEWYIVGLIIFEIALTIFQLLYFGGTAH
jgi:required for meiotic nuclear division protein 1